MYTKGLVHGSFVSPNYAVMSCQPKQEGIVDVYTHNLESSMRLLQNWIDTGEYGFLSLDTEFPGILKSGGKEDNSYTTMVDSVNQSKLIQLGITLYNDKGEKPKHSHTFQFNFHFDETCDNFNQSSLDLLKRSGLNFGNHKRFGISEQAFATAFEKTGLLRNDKIVWLCFHGSFDLAYLVRIFSRDDLRARFLFDIMLKHLFPFVIDLKCLANEVGRIGGLEHLSKSLNVKRDGKAHTAGSDAILTGDTFYALLKSSVESRDKYWSLINKIHALSYEE